MNPEEREEIERICQDIEVQVASENVWHEGPASELLPLARFARQQLKLHVDGQKLISKVSELFEVKVMPKSGLPCTIWKQDSAQRIEALALECLTTEDKE